MRHSLQPTPSTTLIGTAHSIVIHILCIQIQYKALVEVLILTSQYQCWNKITRNNLEAEYEKQSDEEVHEWENHQYVARINSCCLGNKCQVILWHYWQSSYDSGDRRSELREWVKDTERKVWLRFDDFRDDFRDFRDSKKSIWKNLTKCGGRGGQRKEKKKWWSDLLIQKELVPQMKRRHWRRQVILQLTQV